MSNLNTLALTPVTSTGQIKEGDILLLTITGKKSVIATAVMVVPDYGEEVIFNKPRNQYFNTTMILKGHSAFSSCSIIPDVEIRRTTKK